MRPRKTKKTHKIVHSLCYLLPVEQEVSLPLVVRVGRDRPLEVVQERAETALVHKLHDHYWYHTNVIQIVLGCKGEKGKG